MIKIPVQVHLVRSEANYSSARSPDDAQALLDKLSQIFASAEIAFYLDGVRVLGQRDGKTLATALFDDSNRLRELNGQLSNA